MIKKLFYFSFILFIFILFPSANTKAKEYCHLYVNQELKETVELPFYFYENTMTTEATISWPKITFDSSYKIISSITQCESINKKVILDSSLTNTSTVYDYSKNYLSSYTAQQLYQNSKLNLANSTIKGYSSIIDEEAPLIKGYKEYYTTNVNNPIDLSLILNNISAYDQREGNLTSNIKIEYNEYEDNLDKLGIYPIILSVEDSSLNKTSITFYIEIADFSPPLIEGKQKYTSYLSSPLNIEEIKNELVVIDNVDEKLESQIYTCDDTYYINKNKVGLYFVFFCVYDKSNNLSVPFKAEIEVKDDIAPIIEGLDFYTSKLSSPLSIEEIIYSLAASDNGEDISKSIFVVNDYYSNNKNSLGEKVIVFQAMDSSNNLSEPFKVTINLIDDIKPQIFGLDNYTSYLSSPLSLTYFKQQLSVLDNFDGNISSNLEIIFDNYTNNINNKGTYNITFQAKDTSNNISEPLKITITNIDDVSPSITGPNNLTYSLNNKPNIDNILSEYMTTDNIDNNLQIKVEDESYSEANETGTYYIKIFCEDTSNNKSVPFTIKVNIVEKILNINEVSLYLPTNKLFTNENINRIINFKETYTIIEDTYTPNYSIPGIYVIEYQLEDYSKLIIQIETYTQLEKKQVQKKETFLTKIKSFFIKIFNYLKIFFKNLISLSIYLNY